MTREQMLDIADTICDNLAPEDAGDFAFILKDRIMAAYTEAELQLIDALLYEQGIDVSPLCRKVHPPAPPS
jgi:hypothetical protein